MHNLSLINSIFCNVLYIVALSVFCYNMYTLIKWLRAMSVLQDLHLNILGSIERKADSLNNASIKHTHMLKEIKRSLNEFKNE